jgi:hypothetical protein
MSDDLVLPTVPEPKPDDPEDVSWALSTAEAMWARGDHAEGIKWVRRAAEAASEAESDERALELAKAVADLTALIAKPASRASIDIEEIEPMSEPAPAQPPPAPPAKHANKPAQPKPGPNMLPKPAGATRPVSRPPAPLPSKTSQPPPAPGRTSQSPKPAAKPLGTNTTKPASIPPGKSGPESKSRKGSRKSRENLEAEARAALNAAETAPQPVVDAKITEKILPADTAETKTVDVPVVERKRQEDPTLLAHVNDIRPASKSIDEWDVDSTQNLTGDDFPPLPSPDGDRQTALFPADLKATLHSFARPDAAPKPSGPNTKGTNPPATVAGLLLAQVGPTAGRSPADRHDAGIVTMQAVRVIVWRDNNGVHVAPAGTVVSAITVDAVLVALEPNTDLTAWLTQPKGR